MSEWSPPSVPRKWAIGIGLLYVFFLLYAVLAASNVLLGILPGLLILSFYVTWRFLVVLEAIAGSLQRIAQEKERE